MKLFDLLKTASGNLLRNKGRTILTIIAIFVGAFTISLTMGINTGVNDYMDRQVDGIGGESSLFVTKGEDGMSMGGVPGSEDPDEYDPEKANAEMEYMTAKDVDRVKKIKNIKTAEPYLFLMTDYIQGKTDKKYVLDAATSNNISLDLESGRQINNQAADYEIDLAPEYLTVLGYKNAKDALNKKVKIAITSQATGEQELLEATIVGVRNKSVVQGGNSIVNRALAEKVAEVNETGMPENMKNQYYGVAATMAAGLSNQEVTQLKEALNEEGYSGMTVEDEITMIRTVINAITGVLTMFGAIALLAASFGIINTLYMSVQERTREIGLMKAMGMSSLKVFLSFSFEALLIGFWGSLLGVLGAFGAGQLINSIAANSFLETLTGFHLIEFSLPVSLIIIGIIMVIALIAGTFPANRAARLDPINALRYE